MSSREAPLTKSKVRWTPPGTWMACSNSTWRLLLLALRLRLRDLLGLIEFELEDMVPPLAELETSSRLVLESAFHQHAFGFWIVPIIRFDADAEPF